MKPLEDAIGKLKTLEAQLVTKAFEDDAFRKKLLENPKKTLAAMTGKELPEALIVRIQEADPNTLTIVVPQKPSPPRAKGELNAAALDKVSGGVDFGLVVTGITEFGVAAIGEV